jgi:hypothetical protein
MPDNDEAQRALNREMQRRRQRIAKWREEKRRNDLLDKYGAGSRYADDEGDDDVKSTDKKENRKSEKEKKPVWSHLVLTRISGFHQIIMCFLAVVSSG